MSLPPVAKDDMNKPRGTCSLCGCAICSATSRYCIACYRKCCSRCPECTDERGKVTFKYQRHQGKPPEKVEGKILPGMCHRCNERHGDDRQLRCTACNNERVVFRLPEEVKSES